jgi:RNA ligase
MLFEPPRIVNIKEVLPVIKDNPAFVVKEKTFYTVIDYMYMSDKMFHDPIERECRGLKFCNTTGKILARPYHKFHNLGEREAFMPSRVDLRQPHSVLEKLDGSMVHTCATKLGIYLMTRMGHTEVAKEAEKFLEANSIKFSRLFNSLSVDDYTYIFEYIGPNNKIVIDYAKEELVLTAIRHNVNGTYIFHDELQAIGILNDVPVVGKAIDPEFEGKLTVEQLHESTKLASGAEGVVVRFDTGEMIKIKADEYCRRHKSKELASSFKGIVELIMTNKLDDILPQLDEPHLTKVKNYNEDLLGQIEYIAKNISQYVNERAKLEQKDFALGVQSHYPKVFHSLAFTMRKGDNPIDAVKKHILSHVSTNVKLESLFSAMSLPIWTYSFFGEE